MAVRVVAMTLIDLPGETTHWTATLAEAIDKRQFGEAHSEYPWALVTSGSQVQALERSEVGR